MHHHPVPPSCASSGRYACYPPHTKWDASSLRSCLHHRKTKQLFGNQLSKLDMDVDLDAYVSTKVRGSSHRQPL